MVPLKQVQQFSPSTLEANWKTLLIALMFVYIHLVLEVTPSERLLIDCENDNFSTWTLSQYSLC